MLSLGKEVLVYLTISFNLILVIMKKKNVSIPIMGLIGFTIGFGCLVLGGHSFIRYQRKCFRRTMDALAEDLKKGFSLCNEEPVVDAEATEVTDTTE